MSEYQYYEFQAVDQPLGEAERLELRDLLTRARISATRFVNSYDWVDFKGNPARLMERYFDLFLYLANWGTRQFSMRLPKRLVAASDLKRFLVGDDMATVRMAGRNLIVDIFRDDVEPDEWDDGKGWLAALAPLRADVLGGDLRVFYLVWLMAVEGGHVRDSAVEPLPSIAPLSACLAAFAEFFGIDRDLVDVAADAGADPHPAGPTPAAVQSFVHSIPEDEKIALLLSLYEGDDPHLGATFRRRCREVVGSPATVGEGLRTAAELRAAAGRLAEGRRRRAEAKAAAERHRRDKERAKARERHLKALAAREEAAWREVDDLISLRNASGYARAAALLADLRDISHQNGWTKKFEFRLADIRSRHQKKGRFLERLVAAGLG